MVCPEDGGWEIMKSDLKRGRWRCFNSIFQKEIPIRGENELFSYEKRSGRRHSRLQLNQILEIVYLMLMEDSQYSTSLRNAEHNSLPESPK